MYSVGIRGAGVAGLILAKSLLNSRKDITVTLFDVRSETPHPKRTFCYFSNKYTKTPVIPECSWNTVKFSGQNFLRTISCEETPYTMIKGDTFFDVITKELKLLGAKFNWNCPSVQIDKKCLKIADQIYKFDLVVDSAFSPKLANSLLWQSFGGISVTTTEPIFNAQEALLMDFGQSIPGVPVSFIYVLPFSPSSALVEHTIFSRSPESFDFHHQHCIRWLHSRNIREWNEFDCEHGAIPMGLKGVTHNTPWPVIGTQGGAIRGGTGFGFQNILTQVEKLTDTLMNLDLSKNLSVPCDQPNPFWQRYADELFLKALCNRPELGENLLTGLISRSSSKNLISFLSGQASFLESLKVMNSVPKLSMIKALCS
jgi:lycopene beta-cyclase